MAQVPHLAVQGFTAVAELLAGPDTDDQAFWVSGN